MQRCSQDQNLKVKAWTIKAKAKAGTLKAKAKAKAWTLEAKAKAKAWALEAKAKAKAWTLEAKAEARAGPSRPCKAKDTKIVLDDPRRLCKRS